ncbi:acyl-CoA synthetase [Kordiimonas sediminis]|uniref:Acyl-CoA synthetase n=1 Tax=Kordiimonas sediminis TaxID=1735581 RepID=A0A919E8S7_9PROT|nr:fatty acyl-AMP ligase [Kordiimonas sediminis]GHF25263.1 acyl-CoA synthetase [Kordiimonas sediminis]
MVETTTMTSVTPTLDSTLPRRYSDFDTLVDALEYAARGIRGANFYNARGDLVESLTWKEVRERAVVIGRKLVATGFKRGDRIALIAETSANFICFFLGCQYASVLPVPLPLPTSFGGKDGYVSQLRGQMESCDASALLAPAFMQEMSEQAADGLKLKFIGDTAAFLAQDGDAEPNLPAADDLAYLQYSSGSTRFPHGVAVTHRSLMSNTHGMGYHGVRLLDDDRCISWLPFYHDMGLVGTFLTTLTCQVSVDFIPTEEFARRPLSWLRVMSANKGTISYSPTFGYDICTRRAAMRASAMEGLDLSSWRVAGIGGDMIRPDVLREFYESFGQIGFSEQAFLPSYGLAECTLGVSFGKVGQGIEIDLVEESLLVGDRHVLVSNADNDDRKREVVNCGRPLPEYDIEVRDEDENVLTEGSVGKVFVRGTSVMREYYGDPETTRSVLSDDGWLDTGDMGYMKNGDLYIVGRAKDMIIVNGRNHWPQDIEWAAEQMDGIKNGDIAAISVPGENAEEVPMILAQCRIGEAADRAKFVDELKKHVQGATGVNCLIELVPPRSLPRTSSGKLSRTKARNQYLSGMLRAIA